MENPGTTLAIFFHIGSAIPNEVSVEFSPSTGNYSGSFLKTRSSTLKGKMLTKTLRDLKGWVHVEVLSVLDVATLRKVTPRRVTCQVELADKTKDTHLDLHFR